MILIAIIVIAAIILVMAMLYQRTYILSRNSMKFNQDDSHLVSEDLISVKGLQETFKILQITDSHVSIISTDEEAYHRFSSRMDRAFETVRHYKTKKKSTPSRMFLELLKIAEKENVNLIVLSGDIVNNPSHSSITFIHKSLELTGIPYIYIAGNHDWHYEGMEGSAENLRKTWIENSLMPLYGGNNPFYSSHVLGGINFVAIDNSTYQVSEAQLQFYTTQLNREFPIVLILHIPLYTENERNQKNITVCGAPHWGWDTDKNYRIEKRERWSKMGNLSTTLNFIKTVKNSSNLIAVLAGHTHKNQINSISEQVNQYVTGSSVNGHYRLMRFEPDNIKS